MPRPDALNLLLTPVAVSIFAVGLAVAAAVELNRYLTALYRRPVYPRETEL